MRIAVLGPLEVSTDDGRPLPVPGGKERLLLALLAAAAPGVVSADRIIESLWNGDRPASARKSLQVHLVHLRSALEPDRPPGSSGQYVVRRGAGYALAGRTPTTSMPSASATSPPAAVPASPPGIAAEAARLLGTALDLWRGEPYGDWPDAPFADAERRRLAEIRTGAVTALLEARLALGEHADVAAELGAAARRGPAHEEWWRLLVLALYRSGRQGDALAAVARARACSSRSWAPTPDRGCGRSRRPSWPRTRRWTARPRPARAERPAAAGRDACPVQGAGHLPGGRRRAVPRPDRLVTGLVARLVDAPLMVVSGPSGAGKSSLVRAGLVPALAAGALPGSAAWSAVVITPGRRPVDALAELTGPAPPELPVLLVCDQLEELWAAGVDPAERTAFLDTVLGLLDDGIVARCVAVLRGDHVGRLAEHAAFAERLGGALVLVPR